MDSILLISLALGMRHGADADHLTALDGLSRIRPRPTNGVVFALGRGLVVAALAAGLGQVVVGRAASLGPWILIAIGVVNLWKVFRGSPAPGDAVRPLVAHPFLLGALLAAGFETSSQLSVLALAGESNPWLLGAAFCGGMVLGAQGPGRSAFMTPDGNSRLAGLLLAVMAAATAGCSDSSRAAGPPPTLVVKVEPVVERDVPITFEYVGTLVGYINAQIRARVSGHLVSQNYKEGSLVKSGDLLFQVDPRPFQTAADQADAKLRLAESQVSQATAQVSASQAQVEQARATVVQNEAQVKRAEATQRQTELDVARYTPLAQRGSVSQQELDNAVQSNLANLAAVAAARAAVLNAQASVTQAQAALEKAQADVQTQGANVTAARAALADARLNLGYTRVLSPIDGIAGFRGANIGDFVGPSDAAPLTTVSQVDPIYAEFPISEQRALAVFRRWDADPRAPRDIELELILADGSVYPTRGRAAALDRQVDVTTGTVLARGVFPNPGNVLRPGQYAKVRAVVEVRKSALLIPQRAVQDLQGVRQVAVVRADETVDVRTVQVDARVGPLWIIAKGLNVGERVIVEGADRVRAGQKVRLASSTSSDTSAPK